jgi:hypothetical protein
MKLNFARVGVLALAALAFTACSGEEGGTALPTDSPPSSAVGSAPPSDSSPAPGADTQAPTAGIDPCSLLSAAELAPFGDFTEGVRKDSAGVRGCVYDRSIENASDDAINVGVNIRDSQGVDEVQDVGDGVETGTVAGGRKAVMTSGNGVCLIALAVGENSRVDVGGTGTSQQEICEITDAMAKIVEPKLPEG